jgi:uncharacterized protein (TIGR00730 family)
VKYKLKLESRNMDNQDAYKIIRPVIKNVAFFGDAGVAESTPEYQDAYEVARILAKQGYTIVNGGGPGVMNAATQGAEIEHGNTISVTFAPKDAPGFEGRYVGNITDKEIKTSNYIERMFKLMENADLYIMFKGGTGTISEFGTAWVLAKLYYGHHKPFILFGSFWRPVVEAIKNNLNIDEMEMSVFKIIDNRDDVLPAIREFEKQIQTVDHAHCKVCSDKAFMT